MEDSRGRTVSKRAIVVTALASLLAFGGCSGRFAGPRTLAAIGSLAIVGGGASWAAGETLDTPRDTALVNTGFVAVAAGVAAIVVAGGWMATAVSCNADPDCAEDEQCREVPAPPGGVPYKQCMTH
jgi:hypothetical protein